MLYELSSLSHIERTALLSSCVGGTKYYSERKWFDPVFKQLEVVVGKTNKARERSIRWFVSCTAKALRKSGSGFIVGLTPAWFNGTKQKIGFRNSTDIIYLLEREGYVDIYKGFVEQWERTASGSRPVLAHPSVIVMKPKFRQLWDCVNISEIPAIEDNDVVCVRDRQTKEEMPLSGMSGITKIREGVNRFNERLSKSTIRILGKECAKVEYRRIFSDDLEKDGRYYAIGGGVQTAPSILRKTSLHIDDDKTVELDFKAMHPNLLLEMLSITARKEGKDFDISEDFSPYDVDIESLIELDQEAIHRQSEILGAPYNPVRNLKKQALLVMINAESEESARGALCQKLATDKKRQDPIDRLFVGIKGSLPMKEIMARIVEHNEIIAPYMYKDTGIALMNMDSRIAERVIDAMLQEDEPVLCYHDSFIVKYYMEDYLRLSMEKAWKAVMLDNKFCKIEKK